MTNFELKIIELSKDHKIKELETLIKERLNADPNNVQLWLKLALVEQTFPFEDYYTSAECLKQVLTVEPENPIALLMLAYAYHYVIGGIDETLMNRLNLLHTGNNEIDSMLKYAVSWYYQFNNIPDLEEKYLKESIAIYSGHVWNYVYLANLLISNGMITEAKELIKKALHNVKKVYIGTNFDYDSTNVNDFLNSQIKGNCITDTNLEYIQKKLNK